MHKGPLAGVKVLDLTRYVAGPFATKFLADMGAEVIKVEQPGEGDPTRQIGPFPSDIPHPEKSGLFLHLNTNKLSVTLNLQAPDGRAILKRLLQEVDVVVENFAPGVMADWELDYPHLKEMRPSLVMASISNYGQDGPYRDYQGVDLTFQALGGSMYAIGYRDGPPMKVWGYQAQYLSGAYATVGIMTALVYRAATGRGRYVDAAIVETLPPTTSNWVSQYFHRGVINQRLGHRISAGGIYPWATLPCKDGYVWFRISRGGPEAVATLVGDPRLAAPELQENPGAHADEIDELLIPWLMQQEKRDFMARGQALRMPFSAVFTVDEVLADPDHKARGFFPEVDHPAVGRMTQIHPPFRFSATPGEIGRAPLLGEHNALIYRDRLGYSDADITRLRTQGII